MKENQSELILENTCMSTLDDLLEGVQLISPEWKYLYVNNSLATQSKYSKEELIGYTMMEKYPGIEKTPLFKILKRCMQKRVSQRMENEFSYPDGTKGWFELSIQPVPDGLIILSNDISERKKAGEKITMLNKELEQKVIERTKRLESTIQQLRESEERIQASLEIYSTVFYKSPVMKAITDSTTGKFIDVNENFIEFCGFTKEEIIGKSALELNLIPSPEHRTEIINFIKEKGFTRDVLMEMRVRNGEYRWVSTSAHSVVIKGQKCFLTALINVTERKNAEKQLESVNKELEAFTYSVSHDLRAPLRAVNGYAGILEEDYSKVLDTEGQRLLFVIRHNAKKMGTLIDDLLDFSKLGRKEIKKTNIDTNDLVEAVLFDLNRSSQHKAKFKIDKLHLIYADYSMISQVFINLLSNAIKFSSKKEEPVVELKSAKIKSEIIFSVKDNGVGFDMKYSAKLFGVFQRLHPMNEFEGTGVGLALVQRIINKHKGRVWVEAKPNEGATFYFSLPAS